MIVFSRKIISTIILSLFFSFLLTPFSEGAVKHLLTIPDFHFVSINRVAVDSAGNVYITDTRNFVSVFEPDGMGGFQLKTKFGSFGNGDGEFDDPRGIGVDNSGNIHVLDNDAEHIQVFDPDMMGGFQFDFKFGSGGSDMEGLLSSPEDLALDSSGNIYITDRQNGRIQVFNSSGIFQFMIGGSVNMTDMTNICPNNPGDVCRDGSSGNADGQFISPFGVAVDSSSNIYVADTNNNRIQVFNSAGVHQLSFGSSGSADGRFDAPRGVAVDNLGNIYVADTRNDRIQVFNSAGTHQLSFGSRGSLDGEFTGPEGIAVDNSRIFVTDTIIERVQVFDLSGNHQVNISPGAGAEGHFNSIAKIDVDNSKNIYAVDGRNFRIQVLNSIGEHQFSFGSFGNMDGEFGRPVGIAVDSAGKIYVTDIGEDRIQVFNSSGVHQLTFGTGGSADGQFDRPDGIAVDSAGNIYVIDRFNHRFQVFDSSGTFLFMVGSGVNMTDGSNICPNMPTDVCQGGSLGNSNSEFNDPEGIEVDSSGNIYIADTQNDRIQVFNSLGVHQLSFGTSGTADGQLVSPSEVSVDNIGNIYIVERGNDRFQVFDSAGTHKFSFGTNGTADGQFATPSGIAVDSMGNIYVGDNTNDNIQIFTPLALLKIIKETLPGGGSDFDFTSTMLNGLDSCELDDNFEIDNGETKSCVLPIDTDYTVSETVPAGMVLDISCIGSVMPSFTPDPPTGITTTGTIEFDIASVDDDLICTFINSSDMDGDGTADFDDNCPNDPGKIEPGICGCGVADTDTDTDGTPDCNEDCDNDPDKLVPGVCGCGTADTDTDTDGTADCNEECDNDPDKTEPGICGCSVVDNNTDTDSDGTPDCIDLCVDDPDKTVPGVCGCGVPEGCNAGDDDDDDNDDDNNDTVDDTEPNSPPSVETEGGGTTIEIINEDDNNPLGPVTINIDLPDGILPQSAVGNPANSGTNCSIFNTESARIAEGDIDISCEIDNIEDEFDLILGLCNDGSNELVAEALIEIISPDLDEDQEDIIEIIVNQLNTCQLVIDSGNDNNGDEGCTVAPAGTKPSASVFMFLLLPAFVLIKRRLYIEKKIK